MTFAARAREDVEKLDTRARKDVTRLRHIALVSLWRFSSYSDFKRKRSFQKNCFRSIIF